MLNCEEARLQIGADPAGTAPLLEAHVAGAPANAGVAGAAGVSSGGAPVSPPPSARADAYSAPLPTARRWMLAASVLLVGVLAASFFALQPRDALASAVVAHLSEEPQSWSRTQPIPRSALELVLARSGVRLDQVESGSVVYANSCFLRGRQMPHLVVSTPTGPVTVIVLRGESVPTRVEFEEGRYAGVLLPVPGGGAGIAVLTRGGTGTGAAAGGHPDVEAAAARVLAALQFEGEACHRARADTWRFAHPTFEAVRSVTRCREPDIHLAAQVDRLEAGATEAFHRGRAGQQRHPSEREHAGPAGGGGNAPCASASSGSRRASSRGRPPNFTAGRRDWRKASGRFPRRVPTVRRTARA